MKKKRNLHRHQGQTKINLLVDRGKGQNLNAIFAWTLLMSPL